MVDAKAELLELPIAGRDFELTQSPGILQSARGGVTTNAAVWKTSVRLVEWLAWPQNPLFEHKVLNADSIMLELNTGISGLVPLVLSSRMRQCFATDQAYVLKALNENIRANTKVSKTKGKSTNHDIPNSNISTFALDWENDNIASELTANGVQHGVDVPLAIDCIYNYALLKPLVQTCTEICQMRVKGHNSNESKLAPTICVFGQQLRQPDVFEQWLHSFHLRFRVWRVPNELLVDGLKEGSGFVVHVGILRDDA